MDKDFANCSNTPKFKIHGFILHVGIVTQYEYFFTIKNKTMIILALAQYKRKRVFSETPEPEGKLAKGKSTYRFVVQKHHASRLHYDFRLEMDGVLKSWAVPKGPSLNPDDKRLAMHVEDHPMSYRLFEGIIPEGNYGAGAVIVWDEGTYEPIIEDEKDKKLTPEKLLLKQYKAGNLKISLKGKKLKGAFALVSMKKDDKSWLLIKKDDRYASKADITQKEKSVISTNTIEKLDKQISKEKEVSVKKSAPKKIVKSKPAAPKKKAPDVTKLLNDPEVRTVKRIPSNIVPMFASLADQPFNGNKWIYEIKWDGYRALAYLKGKQTEIISRNNISFTTKFHPVTEALKEFPFKAVLDGEIVALSENGNAVFQYLQSWQKTGIGNLRYCVFDILWYEGYDLTQLPLVKRKEILKAVLPKNDMIVYSDHIVEKGEDFFKAAIQNDLEGIMAKKAESIYTPGLRTDEWLKIKTQKRQEVIIAGYTEGRSARKHFGALVLGIYEGDRLIYIGHTGSGFNQASLESMWKKLQRLKIKTCPFDEVPKTNMPATWVKPQLVAEVKFQEWTNDNKMRHPIFLGLREDKKATDVKKEQVKIRAKKKETKEERPKTTRKPLKSIVDNGFKNDQFLPEGEKEVIKKLQGHDLKLTNLDKYLWKKDKYTKGDLISYYHRIAPYMLPYMMNRPQSLNRHPNGITQASFYQKDVKGKVPAWIKTHKDFSESNDAYVHYMVCTNEASLIYMANLGCIEMNPWHSTTDTPDHPDYCIIDLDPNGVGFDKVIETALVTKQILDDIGASSYCKTSGATGLHIYIPLNAKYDYDQSKQLAQLIATLVQRELPSITSIERNPAKRKRKVYVDFLQNRQSQTIACVYSLRPKPGATVSTPLHWEEVKKGLSPEQFHMHTIFDRLKSEGDLFSPVLKKGIDINKVLNNIEKMLSAGLK